MGRQIAILVSGGIDSAVLLGEAVRCGGYESVHPLVIRQGLAWEEAEQTHLRHFVEAIAGPTLRPIQVLEQPVDDLYGEHWSLDGRGVPDADSPDDAVKLPGRNVLLLAKPLIWCRLRGVEAVALAILKGNPFADATPAFFGAFGAAVGLAIGGAVRIERPYAGLDKVEVLRRGRGLPLEWTFSCIDPRRGQHCGACNKCAERRRAFDEAAIIDPTDYAS